MITIQLDSSSETPIYLQLYRHIRAEIESGRIKTGEKLPSKRALASHMNISVVTVESAYGQLLSEGYIYSKAGSGFYVEENYFSEELPKIRQLEVPRKEILHDFSTSNMDTSFFPFSVWAKLSRNILSEKSTDLLNSCDYRGIQVLREEIALYLKRFRGIEVSPDRIIVGAGSEYLLGLIIQLLGRDMAYGVENPGYKKIYDIFSINTSRVFPVPMDDKGASPSFISGFGINVLHVTPSHHFPLGTAMPIVRRQELLQWAYSQSERYIIEDDCDCEFCYNGRPAPTLQSMDSDGRVIYINTFTKTLAPSMRIGYMVLPEGLAEKFRSRLGFYSCTVPVFEQFTLAKFMREGHFERHLNRMKKLLRQRRDTLIESISSSPLSSLIRISGENSGVHIVLKVNNGMSQSELISAAAQNGVNLSGLSEYYSFPVSDIPESTVILGFSGISADEIRIAAKCLIDSWSTYTDSLSEN